ncbi:PD-(D/E)XK motif protein [Micromonospora sp. LOL_021]|uniref:PD-(D/E)XK motif protein n=1 Tax=Micromonospora sp. LOL_021 TaxID=3345417 RepID=UPI003A8B1E77
MTDVQRHLSGDSFAKYIATGLRLDHPIQGKPRVILFFDPERHRIGLRAPAHRNEEGLSTGLEHLRMSIVHYSGRRMVEVAVTEPQLFLDAYPVLCGIADRSQLDGMTVSQAMQVTLRRLGHLIRSEQTLTREVETGLLGELALLAGLANTMSPDAAISAWRRGTEEHDFGLSEFDVEVKSTTSESRTHRVSSLTQLQPTANRPLWLLSLQITEAGTAGVTVAQLIAKVRSSFTTLANREDFDLRVRTAGWRHRYEHGSLQRWRLRNEPATFQVAGDFPRLTPALLATAGADLQAITNVSYRVDLTGRSRDQAPSLLDCAVKAGELELQ